MMNKKMSSVEIIYQASSYRNLGHITNYECQTAFSSYRPFFNHDAYQRELLHARGSEITRLIHERATHRAFSGNTIQRQDLLYLLFNAYSLKNEIGSFTIPQAGGLMVMSLYVLENKKSHWQSHRYDPTNYTLIKNTDAPVKLESIFYTKSVSFESSSHCIIIASRLALFSQIYLTRAYKFACFQAGHIAQNLLLTAINRKIRGVTLGALIEDEIAKACSLDKEEYPLYAVVLGK